MQDRAAKTRRQLIRSAAELFERDGFAGASIGQICARADVSRGALHFHFRNKQALGEAVESTAREILLCVTGQVPAGHPAPLQVLVDTSHALARRVSCDLVLRAGFGLAHDAGWHSEVSLWQHWRHWVRGLLDLARRQGSLAVDADLDDAVSAITALMAGLEGLEREPGGDRIAQSVTPFWRLVLPRLAAEPVRDRIEAAGSFAAAAGEPPLDRWQSEGDAAPHACGSMSDPELCCVPRREMSGSAS
ncbi:ScbR family autoregulator-binding transcription factor [Streptomyces sp. NRRL B-3648]|uniref:ScbR family autoregulator-binding transcription factor n=1 Tax=Streptomyces sp. NRRL B-3648 TaxID=1519493 RepID=UPI0006ADE7C3|nr:ScbR family autoregulator-binding transcription factor [Streptomyces sp. NRRL B-3648]KOX07626.1 gamma-butyrolactone-binding protein [Streptomyces sp. NRRL B-3648]